MADCGCKVELIGVEPDMKVTGTITRCALHANAEKLREALKKTLPYVDAMQRITMPSSLVDKALSVSRAARAVLAEAEGD